MRNVQCFITVAIFAFLMQVQGQVVFNDTFQAAAGTAPNIDYVLRQANGSVTSSYGLTTDGGRVENGYRIEDNDSDGETALTLKVYKPLGGTDSTSWTAARTAVNFGPHLTNNQYTITVDSQFVNGGGNPAGFDTAFAVGLMWSVGATTTPMAYASLFGISLDGTGGGFDVYSASTLLHHADTGSSIVWQERFELQLVVTENGADSTVQVLVQGADDESPTDLGTYTVDMSQHSERILQLYGRQTDNGSGEGGYLMVDTYDLELYSGEKPVMSAYETWSNRYALVEGPDGDDDQDGMINLYEFGLGGNPTNSADQGYSSESGVITDNGTNWLVYVYPMMSDTNSGLSYYLELTDDLVSPAWSNIGYTVSGTGTNAYGVGFDAITNRISTESPAQFVRLKIDQVQ